MILGADGDETRNLLQVDAVWDIETANWDQFVSGAVWDVRSPGSISVYDSEDDFAQHLLGLPKGATVWAHAGGKFDVLWLLDWCHRRGKVPAATIRMSGSSIASMTIRHGPTFRDSARLMPMTLADCCQMFPGCANKQKLELPCVCGDNCGGYCAISPSMSGSARRRMHEYLRADVEALRDTLFALISYASANGMLLGGTVASTGWNTAREKCNLWDAKWDLGDYKTARAGYYGGRCEVGQTRAPLVYRYDRKQAYPAALCKPLPTGDSTRLTRRTAMKAWLGRKPGFYNAAVEVPDCMSPPLPVRFRDRIVYPWGLLFGTWSRQELEHAEECGAQIKKLHGGIVWETEEALLKPHIEHCFELRERATNKALKTWVKFVANSLTGAFAQDPNRDIIALGNEYADDPNWEPVGRYTWIWKRSVFSIPTRGHVHWAGTLTGDARVELHQEILHAGDDWVYSDTDSCHSLRKLTRNTGCDLGQWDYEGEGRDWNCLAPKVYAFQGTSPKKPESRLVAKAKGIPRAETIWPTILAGGNVPLNRGVDSLLVASKKGGSLFQRRSGKRHIVAQAEWCGGRKRDGDRTRPPHMSELDDIPS